MTFTQRFELLNSLRNQYNNLTEEQKEYPAGKLLYNRIKSVQDSITNDLRKEPYHDLSERAEYEYLHGFYKKFEKPKFGIFCIIFTFAKLIIKRIFCKSK